MKTLKTTVKLITISIALVGIASVWTIAEGAGPSQVNPNAYQILSAGPNGLAHGQTLRFSVLNPHEPERTERRSAPVRARVRLYDAQGNIIAQSEEVIIPPGQFRSFDFNRSEMPLAGEPGTGRLQVRAEIEISSPTFVQADGRAVFPASLELVDNSTGRTALALLVPAVQAAREAARRE